MSTVTVACKLPNGMVLDLPDAKEPLVLKGASHPEAVAGYGLTEVDAGFWEAWSKLYADFLLLKKDHIFAQATGRNTVAKTKERKDEKTFLEDLKGLDPKKPGNKLKPEKFEGMPKA